MSLLSRLVTLSKYGGACQLASCIDRVASNCGFSADARRSSVSAVETTSTLVGPMKDPTGSCVSRSSSSQALCKSAASTC